jgi:hypothetical protein
MVMPYRTILERQRMSAVRRPNIVLLLGSAPDVVRCSAWEKSPFSTIVAINNAWRVRQDWDFMVHAGDFPEERLPPDRRLRVASICSAAEYVPAQNAFGGFVYAGPTMAITAAYWILHRFKPDAIAFLGCDMIYDASRGDTHFYGTGTADPLRHDVTLQSLKAKSGRLFIHGLRKGCACLNLSELSESNLVFPRVTRQEMSSLSADMLEGYISSVEDQVDERAELRAIETERRLGYYIESGEYWHYVDQFDAAELRRLDDIWLGSLAGWHARDLSAFVSSRSTAA